VHAGNNVIATHPQSHASSTLARWLENACKLSHFLLPQHAQAALAARSVEGRFALGMFKASAAAGPSATAGAGPASGGAQKKAEVRHLLRVCHVTHEQI